MSLNRIILLVSFFSAMVVTYLVGKKLIPVLQKLKCGQAIKEIGPTWHKSKQGTPTMGGLMMVAGIISASVIGFSLLVLVPKSTVEAAGVSKIFTNLFMALGFALIGFMDDYLKVVKKQNLGLRAREKFGAQLLIASVYLLQLTLINGHSTMLFVPFLGQLDVGWFIYPIYIFIILGSVNAVNITDGLDGLASGVTSVAALGLLATSLAMGMWGSAILAASLAGGCVGFLCWNFYPAKVMMGDVGSLFLGGMLVAVAFLLNIPVALALFGIIYLIETFSVIIQMTFYHFTKRRIFKMSPIHHHFELSNYSEVQINLMFMAVQLVGCLIGFLSISCV